MRASSGLVHFLDNKNSFKLNKLSNNNNNNGGRYSNQSFFNQTLFRKKQINFFHTTSFLQEKPAKKANQSTKEKTVVILGGGISGVSFAYYLLRESLETSKKVKVILIEKNQRVGGWLKTKRTPYGVMEGGAKSMSINTDCLNLLKVIQDVGLNDQLIGAEPLHIPIHLLDKDRLVKLPNNYREILKYPLISTLSKAKMIMKQILFRYSNDEDTSIYDFFRRQTCDSMMKYVIEPESTLEFFGDPREISMKATSRELFDLCNEYGTAYKSAYHFSQLEKGRKMADRYIQTKKAQATALKNFIYELDEEKSAKYSSAYEAAREAVLPLKYHPNHVVIRKGMSFSFRNGMSTLPEAIVQYLLDNFPDQFDIHRRERVIALEINKDEKKVFILTKGAESKRTTIECDYIVSAIPAYELSKLVERQSPKVKRLLNMIPYNPVGVANFAYDHLVDAPFPGSGFIVNDREKRAILSLQFDRFAFFTFSFFANINILLTFLKK